MCDNQLELTVVWWRSCIWCDHLSSPARQGMDAWPISSGFRLMMNTITRACARVCVCVCLCVCIKPHTNSIPGHSIGVPDTNYSFASLSHFIMLFWDFVKLHYHFIIWEMWMAYWGWFETILLLYLYGIWPSWTRDDSLPSWNVDGSFNLHFVCEIFTEDDCDHPELGMIDYHPWMWMVNSTFILWNFYWGWLWPSCSHTLYGMTILW